MGARTLGERQRGGSANMARNSPAAAYEMLVAVHERQAVRLKATNKLLDRVLGKAPKHGDVTALRHTEIVYRSPEEIRQELINRGMPEVLLDYSPKDANDK